MPLVIIQHAGLQDLTMYVQSYNPKSSATFCIHVTSNENVQLAIVQKQKLYI